VLVTQASVFEKWFCRFRSLFVPGTEQQGRADGEEDGRDQRVSDARLAPTGVDYRNLMKDVDNPEQNQATSRHSVDSHFFTSLAGFDYQFAWTPVTTLKFRLGSLTKVYEHQYRAG
jgi:hypothetical protein